MSATSGNFNEKMDPATPPLISVDSMQPKTKDTPVVKTKDTPVVDGLKGLLANRSSKDTTTDGNLGSTNNLARQFFASIRRVFKSEKPPSTNTFQVLTPSKTPMTSQNKAVSTAAKNILSPGKGVAGQELTTREKFIQGALEEVINTEKRYQRRLNVLIQLKEILDNPETQEKLKSCLKTPEERVLYESFMGFFSGDDLYAIKNESEKILKNLNDNAKKLNSPSRNDRMEAVKDMGRGMEALRAIKLNYEKLAISHSIFEEHKLKFNERTSTAFEFNKELISEFDAILRDKEITYDGTNKGKIINIEMENIATLQMEPIQRLARYAMPWKEVLSGIQKELTQKEPIYDKTFLNQIQDSYGNIEKISQLCNRGIKDAIESRNDLMNILDTMYMANRDKKNISVDENGKLIVKKDILINLKPKAAKENGGLAIKTILSNLEKILDSKRFITQVEMENALELLENLKQMKEVITAHRGEIQALKAKIAETFSSVDKQEQVSTNKNQETMQPADPVTRRKQMIQELSIKIEKYRNLVEENKMESFMHGYKNRSAELELLENKMDLLSKSLDKIDKMPSQLEKMRAYDKLLPKAEELLKSLEDADIRPNERYKQIKDF